VGQINKVGTLIVQHLIIPPQKKFVSPTSKVEKVFPMKTLLRVQKKLYPEIVQTMQERYTVLHSIYLLQPIGRRALARKLGETERIVRREIDFLEKQKLIQITSKGMYITSEGKAILNQLSPIMHEVMGIRKLERKLIELLNINQVIVVAGNSDENDWIKQSMGKACVNYLKAHLQKNNTIAVTGGSTIAAVAKEMIAFDTAKTCLYVPARGGIGERVENQANTIASKMAQKTGGDYRLLYVPDPLSESSYEMMLKEPSIAETLSIINQANVVLHGIGDALTMAKRRKTKEKVIKRLKREQAISEAFGYYFNQRGDIIHQVRTVGIQLEDLSNNKQVIAIAGGTSKAKAIISYFKRSKSNLLITDEGAAKAMVKELTKED